MSVDHGAASVVRIHMYKSCGTPKLFARVPLALYVWNRGPLSKVGKMKIILAGLLLALSFNVYAGSVDGKAIWCGNGSGYVFKDGSVTELQAEGEPR